MRILISGGPGAGSTTTAVLLGAELDLPVFDSDSYFHKPTDPPYQEQNSPEDRRRLLLGDLAPEPHWILSGSISTWEVGLPKIEFGIFLDPVAEERARRLRLRERERFGDRIDPGGDMYEENQAFMQWAESYNNRQGSGRNRETDRAFLLSQSDRFLEIDGIPSPETVISIIGEFLVDEGST